MAAKSADPREIQAIRRLALDPTKVVVAKQVQYDLLAHHLTKEDICDEIVAWIDTGGRVKPTTLHSYAGLVGLPAYEMKPQISNTLFYLKVTLIQLTRPGEHMLLLSAHPDH